MKEQKAEKKRKTDQLDEKGEQGSIPVSGGPSFGARAEDAGAFVSLPIHLSRAGPSDSPVRWRIILDDLGAGKPPLGLEILGDVVLGRGKTGTLAPDLDMEPYNAHELGVSRRHALLRPTANNLYVIDLGSTNGTYHNGVRLGPGVARVLAHQDTLSIGNLGFTIRVVERPEAKPIAKREKPAAAKEDKPEDTKPFESTPEAIAEALPPGSPRTFTRRPYVDDDEIETLIVRPGASPLAGKQAPTEQKAAEERKEPAAKAEGEAAAPKAEKPKEEAKEPPAKAEMEAAAPKAEKPKEEAKEPSAKAEAVAEAPKTEKPEEEAEEPPTKAEAEAKAPKSEKPKEEDKEAEGDKKK